MNRRPVSPLPRPVPRRPGPPALHPAGPLARPGRRLARLPLRPSLLWGGAPLPIKCNNRGECTIFTFDAPDDTRAPGELMKVLIVDDEPDVIEVVNLCFNLRWPEADVVSATTGEGGLRLAEDEKPGPILLRLKLPRTRRLQHCPAKRR